MLSYGISLSVDSLSRGKRKVRTHIRQIERECKNTANNSFFNAGDPPSQYHLADYLPKHEVVPPAPYKTGSSGLGDSRIEFVSAIRKTRVTGRRESSIAAQKAVAGTSNNNNAIIVVIPINPRVHIIIKIMLLHLPSEADHIRENGLAEVWDA